MRSPQSSKPSHVPESRFSCLGAELLCVFRGRFRYQLEFTQGTYEFGIRLFSGGTRAVDRHMVAIFGPNDGFGDVVIFAVALGPLCVDIQFHAPCAPSLAPSAVARVT